MATRGGLLKKERDSLEKKLMDRVDLFEKNSFEIFTQLQVYVRRIARTRDEADILSSLLVKLAESEDVSRNFRKGVTSFGVHFSMVQDHRNALIDRLEKRVISEMTSYGSGCKTVRESIRKIDLSSISSIKPPESDQSASQVNQQTVSKQTFASALPQLHAIQVDRFEANKNADMKRLFLEMMRCELLFHAQAIETLTQSYASVVSINESEDMDEFRRVFNLSSLLPGREGTSTGSEMNLSNLSVSRFSESSTDKAGMKAGATGGDSSGSQTSDSHRDDDEEEDEDDESDESVNEQAASNHAATHKSK